MREKTARQTLPEASSENVGIDWRMIRIAKEMSQHRNAKQKSREILGVSDQETARDTAYLIS